MKDLPRETLGDKITVFFVHLLGSAVLGGFLCISVMHFVDTYTKPEQFVRTADASSPIDYRSAKDAYYTPFLTGSAVGAVLYLVRGVVIRRRGKKELFRR